jgi:hypothetical protein
MAGVVGGECAREVVLHSDIRNSDRVVSEKYRKRSGVAGGRHEKSQRGEALA